jgi:HNH endonuclease
MEFFETYYFANIIHNVVKDPMPFVRNLDDFYGDEHYHVFLRPFHKYSALHAFIEHIQGSVIQEGVDDIELDAAINSVSGDLWVNRALRYHGINHIGFREWMTENKITAEEATEDDLSDYHAHLYEEGPLEKLTNQMVEEVFFLMFANRAFLGDFNRMMAKQIHGIMLDELDDAYRALMDQDGVLKRVHLPEWVKKAVLYRDRGACGTCNQDISGLICIGNQKNFDHIVPLAQGGLNDVTNIQLLCEACNLKKGHGNSFTSKRYERWY